MRTPLAPRLPKWPFLAGDALLLGLAFLFAVQSRMPMGIGEIAACSLCVALAAGCGAFPFILEYRVVTRLIVVDRLAETASEIRKLEQYGVQISSATAQWQSVQESADKTAAVAKGIADRMASEAKDFAQFMQQANDRERAALRLEVEKLRRAEVEWLQVVVRVLDHVYALHQGGVRSGQRTLIEQLGQFQDACREAARRQGLAPFAAAPAEPFDKQRHQLAEEGPEPGADAIVDETIATGYTFQGRLLRPALVRVRSGNGAQVESPPQP